MATLLIPMKGTEAVEATTLIVLVTMVAVVVVPPLIALSVSLYEELLMVLTKLPGQTTR